MNNTANPSAVRKFLDGIGGMTHPQQFIERWPGKPCLGVAAARTQVDVERMSSVRVDPFKLPMTRVLWLEVRELIDLTRWLERIDWVILSGSPDSPTDLAHLRRVLADRKAAGVPCWVRSIGAKSYERLANHPGDAPEITRGRWFSAGSDPSEWPADLRCFEIPKCLEVE